MLSPSRILDQLASIQSEADDGGIFPSERYHRYLPLVRAENNIFFTASIVCILQKLDSLLSPADQRLAAEICGKAVANYPAYRNPKHPTYNFWPIGKPHFPNGRFLHKIESIRIPDDADDTSLIYLTKRHTDEEVLWLKDKLAQHSNLAKRRIVNTWPEYRDLRAYSTFFGSEKMPVEFDSSVLSNILLFVYNNKLTLNVHDHDSLKYIRSVLSTERYLRQPYWVSHSYPDTALIVYHVARLMEDHRIDELEDLRSMLIKDLLSLLKRTRRPMTSVIASTSLLRLGYRGKEAMINSSAIADHRRWDYFVAGFGSGLETRITKWIASTSLFHMKYHSRAHSLALILENQVYRESVAMNKNV